MTTMINFNTPIGSHSQSSNSTICKHLINPEINVIPAFYPLERTHKIIKEDELQTVLNNLCRCLHALSIQAKCEGISSTIALLTPENIEMNLYFWEIGSKDNICVELQRRRGDSIIFHRYAKCILQSATKNFTMNQIKKFCPHPNKKFSRNLLQTKNSVTNNEESILRHLESASNLIESDGIDVKLLGMESLAILTDPSKTKLDVAIHVSRAVIHGNFHHDQNNNSAKIIHEFVMKMVQNQFIKDEELQDMMAIQDGENKYEVKSQRCLRMENTLQNYGLIILSNSLETLKNQIFSANSVESYPSKKLSLQNNMLINLLKEVDNALSRPHNASIAAKCLHLLCSLSPSTCSYLNNQSGMQITMHAEKIGKATNFKLQQECEKLRLALCDNQ